MQKRPIQYFQLSKNMLSSPVFFSWVEKMKTNVNRPLVLAQSSKFFNKQFSKFGIHVNIKVSIPVLTSSETIAVLPLTSYEPSLAHDTFLTGPRPWATVILGTGRLTFSKNCFFIISRLLRLIITNLRPQESPRTSLFWKFLLTNNFCFVSVIFSY